MPLMTEQIPLTPLEAWIATKIDTKGRPLRLDHLRTYQLAKLNETLSRVQRRSTFYRRLLGESEVGLSTLEDLADLPFTTADDLRAAPFDFLCVSQNEVERIVTLPTSGTTGPPKRIFFTVDDQELTRDFFHHGMSTLVGPNDRVLILLPGSLPGSVGDLLKEGLERMSVCAVPHGPVTDPQYTLDVIRKERITALVGIPIQVLALIRLGEASGRPRPNAMKSILLSTDRVPHAVAKMIRDVWKCDVYNHYGTTEMGLGGGVDCRAFSGYHMREADLYFEVIDPATARPATEGEAGELVFTTLTRTAMPLIRYRTGDISRVIPGPCPCGTVLRRLAHVDTRLVGGIVFAGGETLRQRDFDEALLPIDGLIDFRVRFKERPKGATLVVEVLFLSADSGTGKEEVLRALRAIPELGTQTARRQMEVEVLDWDARHENRSGTAKRQITHIEEDIG